MIVKLIVLAIYYGVGKGLLMLIQMLIGTVYKKLVSKKLDSINELNDKAETPAQHKLLKRALFRIKLPIYFYMGALSLYFCFLIATISFNLFESNVVYYIVLILALFVQLQNVLMATEIVLEDD